MQWFRSKTPKRQPQLLMPGGYTFRRSRTITGTTSARVTPGATATSQLKTPRLQIHELKKVRSLVVKVLCALLVVSLPLLYAILNHIGTIVIVTDRQSSISQVSAADYRTATSQYFGEHPLERFSFLLNEAALRRFMLERHSELSDFAITKQWYGGDVRFAAKTRQPLVVWQTGGRRYYVDGEGVAFTQYQGDSSKLVVITDQSGVAPSEVETAIASKRFITFLGKLVGAINGGGKGRVGSVIVPPSAREIDIKLEGRDCVIKTNSDRDPSQQAEDVLRALAYFDAQAAKPHYIDARVGGKAFYR